MTAGDRLVHLNILQRIRRHGLAALEDMDAAKPPTPGAEEENSLAAIDWAPALRTANVWYDRLDVVLREPMFSERKKKYDALVEDLRELKDKAREGGSLAKMLSEPPGKPNKALGQAIGEVTISLLMPAAGRVSDAVDRADQAYRNLTLAFAIHAFKKDTGRYPPKLTDLAPKYLPSVPNDLFSDKPLVYKPTADGYLLYSVGVNGKDDGGRTYDDKPAGDDLVVRVPRSK